MSQENHTLRFAAYGHDGWQPRERTLREEIGKIWSHCGISTEWFPLKHVLLHRPGKELEASIRPDAVQMLQTVDRHLAQAQHDALAEAYQTAGVRIDYVAPPDLPTPNQMFVADLMLMTPEGAIVGRPASTVRAGEERHVAHRLAALGIPIVRTIRGKGTFEGADAAWLNPQTVLIGRGLRTNADGAAQTSAVLQEMGVQTHMVDLPYGTMHLMGMLRLVDENLAVVWPTRFAYSGVALLRKLGFEVIALPDESEALRGFALNFVTLGPRRIMMPAGNPNTASFLKRRGIEIIQVAMDEIVKAAGAIGCLTGILHRASP